LITGSLHTVIVTVGERGAWMIDKNTATRVPAPAVKAVDTTGAGDCFCGVLAAALAEHRPIADAVQCAIAAAAESVQSIGAITALPSRR
jgi:ribokinase